MFIFNVPNNRNGDFFLRKIFTYFEDFPKKTNKKKQHNEEIHILRNPFRNSHIFWASEFWMLLDHPHRFHKAAKNIKRRCIHLQRHFSLLYTESFLSRKFFERTAQFLKEVIDFFCIKIYPIRSVCMMHVEISLKFNFNESEWL